AHHVSPHKARSSENRDQGVQIRCHESISWVKFEKRRGDLAVSRYAIRSALYSISGARRANLTNARPVRSNRPRAQVVELVDALASGASGLTAVKVRVLSWAPRCF